MAIVTPTTATATIIKLGRLDCAIKFTGANTVTQTLAGLAKSDETVASPVVNIHALYWNTDGMITVSRNGVVLYYLSNTGFMQLNGFDDPTGNTYDLAIDLGVDGSTLILDVRKIGGYTPPFTNIGV